MNRIHQTPSLCHLFQHLHVYLMTQRGNICRKANKKSPDNQTPHLHPHSV